MDPYMAGPIWVKLSGIEEDHSVHIPQPIFFCQVGQDQVGEHQVPLLGHGVDQETCNLVSRHNWPLQANESVADLSEVAKTKSVYHRCLFKVMGMP